jgi:hypothetical protein
VSISRFGRKSPKPTPNASSKVVELETQVTVKVLEEGLLQFFLGNLVVPTDTPIPFWELSPFDSNSQKMLLNNICVVVEPNLAGGN